MPHSLYQEVGLLLAPQTDGNSHNALQPLRNLCSNGGFEHLLSVALDTTKPDKTVTESSLPDLLWIGLAVIGLRARQARAMFSLLTKKHSQLGTALIAALSEFPRWVV